jgi:hypothetical protein
MLDAKKIQIKQSVKRILIPLVHFLLSQGFTYGEFIDSAKAAFFTSGRKLLQGSGQGETASQLSILTGLHRKDVTAFLQNTNGSTTPPPQRNINVGATIVAKWISDTRYTDTKGLPKILPYQSSDAFEPSFTTLVTGISKDIRPRSYADDLIRLGIVSRDENDALRLDKAGFMPTTDFSEKLKFFDKNISDHLSAAAENMIRSPSPHFDRSMFYAQLSREDIEILRTIVETDGMGLLKNLYKKSGQLADENKNSGTKSSRVTIGLYMYQEETHDEDE